ncbi:MAG: hypothetical protein ACYC10_09250 [Allorhizobium sp.]
MTCSILTASCPCRLNARKARRIPPGGLLCRHLRDLVEQTRNQQFHAISHARNTAAGSAKKLHGLRNGREVNPYRKSDNRKPCSLNLVGPAHWAMGGPLPNAPIIAAVKAARASEWSFHRPEKLPTR